MSPNHFGIIPLGRLSAERKTLDELIDNGFLFDMIFHLIQNKYADSFCPALFFTLRTPRCKSFFTTRCKPFLTALR